MLRLLFVTYLNIQRSGRIKPGERASSIFKGASDKQTDNELGYPHTSIALW